MCPTADPVKPKIFISYSWTNQFHQDQVIEWAKRLAANGVDVVLDVFELKEGQDKYSFMERMVTDKSVTHVLAICDKDYAEKADARKAGVGTESQIISKEVYEKVEQSKFIPVIAQTDEEGNPFLPLFFKSRIWIDFSTPEKVNDNWERLIRLFYGKPLHEKPILGAPPAYITKNAPALRNPSGMKFDSLKEAILKGKAGVPGYRRDFLDACISYADTLRTREAPNMHQLPQTTLDTCNKLLPVRDILIDWILLESETTSVDQFSEALIDILERLRGLKSRPAEVTTWNDSWFEAHGVFVYQTLLYIIAALLKTKSYSHLHTIFTSHFLLPETDRQTGKTFVLFDDFYAHSELLNSVLSPGQRLYSPAAELIKRQATRVDITFADVMEADLLALLVSFITPETQWYPQTLHYASFSNITPFFLRASQHKNFKNLAIITGFESADTLREAVLAGQKRLSVDRWSDFHFNRNFWGPLNMDKLDTIS